MLFGKLPEFFKNEEELRTLWSAPDTRAKLLQGLAEKGFGKDQLAEMQRIIDAEKSDLFDVLALQLRPHLVQDALPNGGSLLFRPLVPYRGFY